MPALPAERLLFRIPVNYGTGKNAVIQMRDPHSTPMAVFLGSLCDGHEHNCLSQSSEQHYDNAKGPGCAEVIWLSFRTFHGKTASDTSYKLELLEPGSCVNQFVSIVFRTLPLRIRETITYSEKLSCMVSVLDWENILNFREINYILLS